MPGDSEIGLARAGSVAGADASDGGLEMLVGLGSDAVEKVSPGL